MSQHVHAICRLQTRLQSRKSLALAVLCWAVALFGLSEPGVGQTQSQSAVRSLEFVPRDALFVANVQNSLFRNDILATVRSQLPLPRLPALDLPGELVEEATFAVLAGRRDPAVILKCRLSTAGERELQKEISSGSFASTDIEGRQVYSGRTGVFVMLSPNTVLIAESPELMTRCLLTSSATGTLWASEWETSNASVLAVANMSLLRSAPVLQQATLFSDDQISLQSLYHLAMTTDYVAMEVSVADELQVRLKTSSGTNEEATQARTAISGSIGAARLGLSAVRAELVSGRQAATFLPYIDLLDQTLERTRIENREKQVAAQMTLSRDALSSIREGLVASVRVASEARRRMQSMNRLKQVGLALHNYASAYRKFPAAVQRMDNAVERSWRVTISPYMESSSVWQAYKQNEPWDSTANRTLIDKIPSSFQSEYAEPGMTDIFVLNGPGAIFNAGEYSSFRNIVDGTSNTIWLVLLPRAVPWTKPEDVPFDAEGPLSFEIPDAGMMVGMADGSVRELPPNVDPDELRKAITAAGGETPSLW